MTNTSNHWLHRREFIRASIGSVVVSGVPLGACTTEPPTGTKTPTLVLVHGAWIGAWAWARLIPLLAEQGIRTVSFDVLGCGMASKIPASYLAQPFDLAAFESEPSSMGAISMDDLRDQVADVIRAVAAVEGPVVVLAHSIAGAILGAVAELVPGAIKRMVYIGAFVPTKFASALEYLNEPNFASSATTKSLVGNPQQTGVARINHRSTDPAYREQVRMAFFGDLSPDEFLAASVLSVPDSPAQSLSGKVQVTATNWGSIPRTYIRLLRDLSIPVAMADQFIAEADGRFPQQRFDIKTLDADHSPFLSQPAALAAMLTTIVQHS